MLDYPSKEGKWTWDQLEVLAKALGYHHKVFVECASSAELRVEEEGHLKKEYLKHLVESDAVASALHHTYNHQNGTYNIKVLSKAIELIAQRYISFSTLRIARISFQTYEHTDHAGLEDASVLRAMQMCGYTMAPMKMKQVLRHMGRLVPDRLMLYEFLELISIADDISIVRNDLPLKTVPHAGLDKHQLYELCDFEQELSTQEQRYYRYLNQKYEDSRRDIAVDESEDETKVSCGVRPCDDWVTPPLVNPHIRKEKSLENSKQSKLLQKHLDASNMNVKQKSYNVACTCQDKTHSSTMATPHSGELQNQLCEGLRNDVLAGKNEKVCPTDVRKMRMPPIVTEEDLDITARKIEGIRWDIATPSETLRKRKETATLLR